MSTRESRKEVPSCSTTQGGSGPHPPVRLRLAGAGKILAGTVNIKANAKTGAHDHGPGERVIYVVKGKAGIRWGERLEFTPQAGPGDFIWVPPFVPHQEIN